MREHGRLARDRLPCSLFPAPNIMRLRFTLLFLLLVAVPLALMAWIGAMLLRQQQTQARESWMTVIEEKLSSTDTLLTQEMTRLENDFDALLQDTALDEASLRELPRSQ